MHLKPNSVRPLADQNKYTMGDLAVFQSSPFLPKKNAKEKTRDV